MLNKSAAVLILLVNLIINLLLDKLLDKLVDFFEDSFFAIREIIVWVLKVCAGFLVLILVLTFVSWLMKK